MRLHIFVYFLLIYEVDFAMLMHKQLCAFIVFIASAGEMECIFSFPCKGKIKKFTIRDAGKYSVRFSLSPFLSFLWCYRYFNSPSLLKSWINLLLKACIKYMWVLGCFFASANIESKGLSRAMPNLLGFDFEPHWLHSCTLPPGSAGFSCLHKQCI